MLVIGAMMVIGMMVWGLMVMSVMMLPCSKPWGRCIGQFRSMLLPVALVSCVFIGGVATARREGARLLLFRYDDFDGVMMLVM